MSDAPNPGSGEAIDNGCACPVMDNNHGMFAPYPPDGWWTHPDCPLHAVTATREPSVQVTTSDAPSKPNPNHPGQGLGL